MPAGLAVLAPVLEGTVLEGTVLEGYAPLHAAHAALLEQAGDAAGGRAAWERAEACAGNEAIAAEIRRRHLSI